MKKSDNDLIIFNDPVVVKYENSNNSEKDERVNTTNINIIDDVTSIKLDVKSLM